MEMASAVISICAVCTIPVIFRAMKGRSIKRESMITRIRITAATRNPRPISGHRLHWIGAEELARMVASDPDLVVFCLVEGLPARRHNEIPGQLNVTWSQLEVTLPWFPAGSRIGIYRARGIDSALARKLAALTQGRETFLMSGSPREVESAADARVREICS